MNLLHEFVVNMILNRLSHEDQYTFISTFFVFVFVFVFFLGAKHSQFLYYCISTIIINIVRF